MSERSNRISKLLSSQESRASYIKAKLAVLVPAQIRALRINTTNPPMPHQRDLAREAELHQSRISMIETPGAANITLETLSKIAAGLRCGVVVKLVPFSEMLRWENSFSPGKFDVKRLDQDEAFLNPASAVSGETTRGEVAGLRPVGNASVGGGNSMGAGLQGAINSANALFAANERVPA
jgi:hypothetical protein